MFKYKKYNAYERLAIISYVFIQRRISQQNEKSRKEAHFKNVILSWSKVRTSMGRHFEKPHTSDSF